MTRPILACVFLLSFAVALLTTLPLSMALAMAGAAEKGLAARDVTGSVWDGALRHASFKGLAIGDVSVRLDSKTLLAGSPKFVVRSGERSMTFDVREGMALGKAFTGRNGVAQ